jgi:Ca2+-binding RTX toxin-like protein
MSSYTLTSSSMTSGPGIEFGENNETWTIAQNVSVFSTSADAILGEFFSASKLINNGVIDSNYLSGHFGVDFVDADNCSIVNHGEIDGGSGIGLFSDGAAVANYGKVWGGAGDGIDFYGTYDYISNYDQGSIFGAIAGIYAGGVHGSIDNWSGGTITGGVYGIEVYGGSGTVTIVFNDAGATIAGGTAALSTTGGGWLNLDNAGTINGDINCTSAGRPDSVTNSGIINGKIHLGSGDDVFADKAGGSSDDVYGDDGSDRLTGDQHSDWLHGGRGNDTLTGGNGNDRFYFDTALNAATNVDTITDFTPGGDRIALSHTDFAKIGATGTLAAKYFHVGAAVTADQHIIYYSSTGYLDYDANGNAAGGQTPFAKIGTGLTLHNTDFMIVA